MTLAFVNPTRRDVMKHLLAAGVMGVYCAPAMAGRHRGSIATLRKDEDGYEDARFNMMYKANVPERYPDVIVKVESDSDIPVALDIARRLNMQIVCRSSGHNSAGAVLRNGGMVLDVSALTGVTVDRANKTATVRPATSLAELTAALSRAGLDFPIGTCDSVAVGGYLMGGGFGRNGNGYCQGPACYALKSAEVILADGRKVVTDDTQNQDLLWTLRGCGPAFFGVVTRMTIDVFEPTTALVTRDYTHSVADLPLVKTFAERASDTMDDRIALNIRFGSGTNATHHVITTITAASTSQESARSEASLLIDDCAAKGISQNAIHISEDTTVPLDGELYHFPKHMSTNTDNFYVDSLDALAAMQDLYTQIPHTEGARITLSFTVNMFRHALKESACFSSRGRHMILHHVTWDANALADREGFETAAHEWMGKFHDVLAPWGKGHFINQADNDRFPERIPASFTPENWARLNALRHTYDPDNLFFTYLGQT